MPPPALTDATAVSRHPNAVVGALPAETILLRVDTGTTLRLNTTGAWIWEQLSGPRDLGELTARLATHYSIDEGTAADDVRRFVSDLARREFLLLD